MKVIAVIPTYNEAENIVILIPQLLKYNVEPLIVDDDSPDLTWQVAEQFVKINKRVHVLRRAFNKGRGSAGIDGFKAALKLDPDYIIEMDADFSHDPKFIPALLKAAKDADLVLGSRYDGGKQVGRSWLRMIVTRFANAYIRSVLGLKVKDCNSGFRVYKRKTLESIISSLNSKGPDIVQEVLYKVHLKGFNIVEVPITFVERKQGESKLTIVRLLTGYFRVLQLRIQHSLGRI